MPSRPGDPHLGFNSLVDLGLGDPATPQSMFSEVSGLGATVEAIEYRLGGDSSGATRKLPGRRAYSNVTLRRGITRDLGLWQLISAEPPDRRDVSITLLDERRNPAVRYRLHSAFPVRWAAGDFNAKTGEVAMETLELCYERLEVEAD